MATFHRPMDGVSDYSGRDHADTKIVVFGRADSMAIRDSRASTVAVRLGDLVAHTCAILLEHNITGTRYT